MSGNRVKIPNESVAVSKEVFFHSLPQREKKPLSHKLEKAEKYVDLQVGIPVP